MKNPPFSKQTNTNTGAFALAQFRTELDQQRFDVGPVDIGAGGSSKYQFQCLLMFALHLEIVSRNGTASRMKY